MATTPKISVIVPVYNTEATLPRCIESVLVQTYRDFELVLVDDGSPDGAGAICDDYAARYTNIVVVHQPNAGLAEARRSGIHAAKGEFIVALDSDDNLPPQALETHMRHIEEDDLDLSYGVYKRFYYNKTSMASHPLTGVLTPQEFLRYNFNLSGCCGSTCNICRRTAWSDDVFPPANKRYPSEDILINVRLSKNLKRIGIFNDYVENYYYNPASLSIGGTLWTLDSWDDWFKEIRATLTQMNALDDSIEKILIEQEIHHLAFYVKKHDASHRWQQRVMAYSTKGFSLKTRVLHALLRTPRLLKVLIYSNRWIKQRIFGKIA